MLYGLLTLAGISIVTQALIVRWALANLRDYNLLAAQERDSQTAIHAAQLAEFANRIQQPERASHISVSEFATDPEPFIHPDIEEELALSGEA